MTSRISLNIHLTNDFNSENNNVFEAKNLLGGRAGFVSININNDTSLFFNDPVVLGRFIIACEQAMAMLCNHENSKKVSA